MDDTTATTTLLAFFRFERMTLKRRLDFRITSFRFVLKEMNDAHNRSIPFIGDEDQIFNGERTSKI